MMHADREADSTKAIGTLRAKRSRLKCFRPAPGPTKHKYSMGTGDSFLGVKQPRPEPDLSPPSSTKVKKERN